MKFHFDSNDESLSCNCDWQGLAVLVLIACVILALCGALAMVVKALVACVAALVIAGLALYGAMRLYAAYSQEEE